jgi:hypothetical protein
VSSDLRPSQGMTRVTRGQLQDHAQRCIQVATATPEGGELARVIRRVIASAWAGGRAEAAAEFTAEVALLAAEEGICDDTLMRAKLAALIPAEPAP